MSRCTGLNRFAARCRNGNHGHESGMCALHRDDPYQEERRTRFAEGRGAKNPTLRVIKQGRQWAEAERKMLEEDLTMAEFVATLSMEELVSGKLKDHTGRLGKFSSGWIPREFHQECIRQLLAKGDKLFREAYLDAIETMQEIMNDEDVDPQHRFKAAQFVVERVAGKTPDRVEISEQDPWQKLVVDIVADNDELNAMKRAAGLLE